MKKHIANRYERDIDGRVLIDVAAEKIEDLYSDFDRSAPYIRRDLDPDLVDYLIQCGKELGKEPYAISFTLVKPPDEARLNRIRRSVNSFFLYLMETQRHKVRGLVRRSMVLFCIGVAMLFISVVATGRIPGNSSLLGQVFAQGLTVAAWVALWEALATFLIQWLPHLGEITLYRRLADAHLTFRSAPGAQPR